MKREDVPAGAVCVIRDIKELIPGGGMNVVGHIENMDEDAASVVMRDIYPIFEDACDRAETICSACGADGREYDDRQRAYIRCNVHAVGNPT